MLPMPLHIPATFRDVPSKIKGVIPEHRNVRYVYYNKIRVMNMKPYDYLKLKTIKRNNVI